MVNEILRGRVMTHAHHHQQHGQSENPNQLQQSINSYNQCGLQGLLGHQLGKDPGIQPGFSNMTQTPNISPGIQSLGMQRFSPVS